MHLILNPLSLISKAKRTVSYHRVCILLDRRCPVRDKERRKEGVESFGWSIEHWCDKTGEDSVEVWRPDTQRTDTFLLLFVALEVSLSTGEVSGIYWSMYLLDEILWKVCMWSSWDPRGQTRLWEEKLGLLSCNQCAVISLPRPIKWSLARCWGFALECCVYDERSAVTEDNAKVWYAARMKAIMNSHRYALGWVKALCRGFELVFRDLLLQGRYTVLEGVGRFSGIQVQQRGSGRSQAGMRGNLPPS